MALDESVPLSSSYLQAATMTPFKEKDKETFYLTVVFFDAVSSEGASQMGEDVDDLPEDCPLCFGILTLREIPEDALASFDMKLNGQCIRASFRNAGAAVLNRTEYRNLRWFHFAVMETVMLKGCLLNVVSSSENRHVFKSLMDDLTVFMQPREKESWYLIVPVTETTVACFVGQGTRIPGSLICQESALQAVAAIRNFLRPGVTQSSLDDPSSVFLSSYNDADYVICSPQRHARFSDSFPRRRRSKKSDQQFSTYAEYFTTKLGIPDLNLDQQLIGAQIRGKLPVLKNARALLDPQSLELRSPPLSNGDRCAFVVPSLLLLHPLTAKTIWAAPVYYATCWMFESQLRVAELRDTLTTPKPETEHPTEDPTASCPRLDMALLFEAVTFKGVVERKHCEKLEFMGDMILKVIATLHSCLTSPENSDTLIETRYSYLSNVALARRCVATHLHKYIRHVKLGNDSWCPPGTSAIKDFCNRHDILWNVDEWKPDKEETHNFKLLADVTEAIIGAFYMSSGLEAAVYSIHRLGIAPVHDLYRAIQRHGEDAWLTRALMDACSAANKATTSPSTKSAPHFHIDASLADDIAAIERVIGYTFKDKSLVVMSIKRKQEAINGSLFNTQRMAFLGDALIDFLITWQLHERKATESVGEWTNWKQKWYNQERICQLCISLGLHRHLRYPNKTIHKQIQEYIGQLSLSSNVSIYGEGMEGSPIVLHFSFQCLVTSTFLDSGGSLAQLRKIWDPLMEPLVCTECDQPTHPIHLLIDHCQKQKKTLRLKLRESCEEELDAEKSPTKKEDVTDRDASVEASSTVPLWGVSEDNVQYDNHTWKDRKFDELFVDRQWATISCPDEEDGDNVCLPIREEHFHVDVVIDGDCIAAGRAASERMARRKAASVALSVLGVTAEQHTNTDSADPHTT